MYSHKSGVCTKRLIALFVTVVFLLSGAAVFAQQGGGAKQDLIAKWSQERIRLKEQGYKYVGNTNSYKFHKIDCKWAKRCYKNCRAKFKTREEALEAGFVPCKVCKP